MSTAPLYSYRDLSSILCLAHPKAHSACIQLNRALYRDHQIGLRHRSRTSRPIETHSCHLPISAPRCRKYVLRRGSLFLRPHGRAVSPGAHLLARRTAFAIPLPRTLGLFILQRSSCSRHLHYYDRRCFRVLSSPTRSTTSRSTCFRKSRARFIADDPHSRRSPSEACYHLYIWNPRSEQRLSAIEQKLDQSTERHQAHLPNYALDRDRRRCRFRPPPHWPRLRRSAVHQHLRQYRRPVRVPLFSVLPFKSLL
jgi:hypothetical protein